MSDLYRITTLHPRTYNDARRIGEEFREGVPVIMNLTDMDDVDAKRLVDFAAGLVFGCRGTIERVTNKVFLLSPGQRRRRRRGPSSRPGRLLQPELSLSLGTDRTGPRCNSSRQAVVGATISWVLQIYILVLIARIVVDYVFMFARDWRPQGIVLVLVEAIYTVTDPPIRLLRRVIPPIRVGGSTSSSTVVFLVLFILVKHPHLGGLALLAVTARTRPS